VLIPGLQGRWEFQRATVDALAASFRVITFSLSDDPEQVLGALNRLGIERAVICGVSFGGLIAMRFAADHPERTEALVLVSAPGPDWHLRPRHELYARLPWLCGPLFLAEVPFRTHGELVAAIPVWLERWRFRFEQLVTLLGAPVSVSRMAARARLIGTLDRFGDCRRISAPTLVVSGEASLDHVVKPGGTAEYGRLIAGATTAVLSRTGHLGSVTRPREFAALVARFVSEAGVRNEDPRRRRKPVRPPGRHGDDVPQGTGLATGR
jgi:pimeloyl-ACP methyl ester carboxylesterase